MAKTPFKMKYTNGKKADVSAFPFAGMINPIVPSRPTRNPNPTTPTSGDGADDVIAAKVDEKVEEKVNEVVNQKTGEGLV